MVTVLNATLKIYVIMNYFGISNNAAKYMYYRRKRGNPWRRPDNSKFLDWNVKIQNALINADIKKKFNWDTLQFGNEEYQLSKYNIDINIQPNLPLTLSDFHNQEDDDGWKTVSYKKKKQTNIKNYSNEKILQNIGFITKSSN